MLVLEAVVDKELLGSRAQLLAIAAIGFMTYFTDPVQRARTTLIVNAGAIDAIVSVACDRNMQGTGFQQQSLDALWAICCDHKVFLRIVIIEIQII